MFGTILAVVIHKVRRLSRKKSLSIKLQSIIAFSTGMQLLASKIETRNMIIAIGIFSAMAPIGKCSWLRNWQRLIQAPSRTDNWTGNFLAWNRWQSRHANYCVGGIGDWYLYIRDIP